MAEPEDEQMDTLVEGAHGVMEVGRNLADPPILPAVPNWFGYYILILNLDGDAPEEDVWREFGLDGDPSVVCKGISTVAHEDNCRRGSVMFNAVEKARQMALQLNLKTVCGKLCYVVHLERLLKHVCELEKQLVMEKWRTTGFDPAKHEVTVLVRCPRGWLFLLSTFRKYGNIRGHKFPEKDVLAVSYTYFTEAFMAYSDFIEKIRLKRGWEVHSLWYTGEHVMDIHALRRVVECLVMSDVSTFMRPEF